MKTTKTIKTNQENFVVYNFENEFTSSDNRADFYTHFTTLENNRTEKARQEKLDFAVAYEAKLQAEREYGEMVRAGNRKSAFINR